MQRVLTVTLMLCFNIVKYQHIADIVQRVLTVTLILWFNRVKYRHTHHC